MSTTTAVVDFPLPATATHGAIAHISVGGSMVLWPGYVNGDGMAKYPAAGNDRVIVLQGVGGTVPTNIVNNRQDNRDVDRNGP